MNKHMKKKGISLITLIITLIIMALLAGAVLLMTVGNDGLFGETQTTVDLANKQTIIDEIKLQIEKKRILKLEQNQELIYEDDVIPILQQFGNYDKETFKLTTTKDNIEIRLDEVFQLGAEDYIDVIYKDKELTVTEKADLTENGYVVEYTKDNGQTWEKYEDTIIIEDVEEIIIRVVDSEGNALGNEIVVANKLKSIYVSTPPNKTIYDKGEAFNPAGMEVTAVYENGTSKKVTNYLYSPKTKLTINDKKIVITYEEGEITAVTTTPIHIIKELEEIGIKELRKTNYRQGETINLDDFTIVARYEDNTLKEVGGYTCSPSGELMSTDKEVVVSYTEHGITKTDKTQIYVTYMTGIEIIQEPTKTFYVKDENFDTAGMRVKAIYANGTEREITGFTATNGNNLPIGQSTVTISYTEGGITKTTEQAIAVRNNVTKIEVTTPPTKTTYDHKDTFDKTGMVITATYEDGTTKQVTNYVIPNPTVIFTQTQVEISYTEKEIYTERDVTVTTATPVTVIGYYQVAYDGNGATSGSTASSTHTIGVQKQLTANGFSRAGYTFLGWSTSKTATTATYTNGATVTNLSTTPDVTVTLYAIWKAHTYTIVYNSNGDSNTSGSTASSTHTYGTAKNLTTNGFTRGYYNFKGWSTSKTATTPTYTNGQSVSNLTTTDGGTVTLYAVWEQKAYTTVYKNDNCAYNNNNCTGSKNDCNGHSEQDCYWVDTSYEECENEYATECKDVCTCMRYLLGVCQLQSCDRECDMVWTGYDCYTVSDGYTKCDSYTRYCSGCRHSHTSSCRYYYCGGHWEIPW